MANLAIVGSHSTNGVAAIHSQLLRTTTVKDLAELFPERFNNKTNGVTPRRWLLMSNPALSRAITQAIGDGWITDLSQLKRLKPLADDASLCDAFAKAKHGAKSQFADWIKRTLGETVDPHAIFDCQIKRIHEYKRQLLNALRIVVLYNRLRQNPNLEMPSRTFFFSGKAAPAYQLAKVIIKFINNLANVIDSDPAMRGRLKVLFLPDYNVSLAERLIPAADVSNQISTAGYEASGTMQHEVYDERRADYWHTRWRNDRDGRGSWRREFLPLWPNGGTGGSAAVGTTRTGTMITIRKLELLWT
jgi:starch phosphorylase